MNEVFVATAAWQFVLFSSCYCLNSLSSLKLKATIHFCLFSGVGEKISNCLYVDFFELRSSNFHC